jgi:hypothetical protein
MTVWWLREDAATHYGVTQRTVQRWIRAGVDAGYITVEQRGQKLGAKGQAQVYRLTTPSEMSQFQGDTNVSPVVVVTTGSTTPTARPAADGPSAPTSAGSTADDHSSSSNFAVVARSEARTTTPPEGPRRATENDHDDTAHRALVLARQTARRLARQQAHMDNIALRRAGTGTTATGTTRTTTRPVATPATYSSAHADARDPQRLASLLPEWLREGRGRTNDPRPEWLREGPPPRVWGPPADPEDIARTLATLNTPLPDPSVPGEDEDWAGWDDEVAV